MAFQYVSPAIVSQFPDKQPVWHPYSEYSLNFRFFLRNFPGGNLTLSLEQPAMNAKQKILPAYLEQEGFFLCHY